MKAIIQDTYGEADVLQYSDVDMPVIGADDVLVRVHAAGVDPGVWHLMTGRPYLVRLGFGLRAPKVPVCGMDLAGRVEAVGASVTRFQPGDDVFGTCAGSFAEYACAAQDKLVLKPENLSFEQAAAVPISACTALQGLRDTGQVRPGQRVLIIGASGGVGTFAVQLAKWFGAHVSGVCSTRHLELVRSIGADDLIDYTSGKITDAGQPYDVIMDVAGNRPLSLLRRALASEGTLVIAGGEGGGPWFGGIDRQLRAIILSSFTHQKLCGLLSNESASDLQFLSDRMAAGELIPIIDSTYPLREAAEAIRHLKTGHPSGKIVITV